MNEDTHLQTAPNPALNIASVSRCPSINFYNVDCIEFMKSKSDKCYDLAIVDPPYGINFAKQHTGKGWTVRDSKNWDKGIPPAEYWEQLFRVSKNQVVWGGNYMTEFLPPSMGWIFWDKGQRDFSLADGELAWTSFNKALRVYEYSRAKLNNNRGGLHPTEKPVQLYRWILTKYAEKGMKILDTHGGSMTIARACEIEGFDLDICEIDSEYYQAGVNAFNLHKRQQRLF